MTQYPGTVKVPLCHPANFIFDDNGIEDSILDACLDYNSNEPVTDEEKIYENYDAASLDSKSAFAPSCNFIFNADEVDVSVSLDDITGEKEVTRSVRDFSDCDSDNNLPQSEEIVHNDLVIFSYSYFYTYPTTLT